MVEKEAPILMTGRVSAVQGSEYCLLLIWPMVSWAVPSNRVFHTETGCLAVPFRKGTFLLLKSQRNSAKSFAYALAETCEASAEQGASTARK